MPVGASRPSLPPPSTPARRFLGSTARGSQAPPRALDAATGPCDATVPPRRNLHSGTEGPLSFLYPWTRWKKGQAPRLSRDVRARLSNLLGIHKGLRIVFADAERGYGWVRRQNAAFGGRSALDVMLGGELTDLMRVRGYLDAERGAW